MNDDVRNLLLAALRSDREALTAPLVAAPEIWQGLLQLARRHRVAPLVYRRMQGREGNVPQDIMRDLHADYLRTAAKNMLTYKRMAEILQRLHEEQIPVLPLKGIYLAEQVYRNIAVRPMGDVDILVKEEDIYRVEKIVLEMGYLPDQGVRVTCDESKHFHYTHPRNRQILEVHWNIVVPSVGLHLDITKVWERSGQTTISGVPVRAMSPEDLLLHLSLHAAVHVFEMGMRMVCDITETILRFEKRIDWRHLERMAKESGATRSLAISLRLAVEFCKAPVPAGFLDAIAPQQSETMYQIVLRDHLFADEKAVDSGALAKTPKLATFWSQKGVFNKMKLLWQRVFPSRQVMA